MCSLAMSRFACHCLLSSWLFAAFYFVHISMESRISHTVRKKLLSALSDPFSRAVMDAHSHDACEAMERLNGMMGAHDTYMALCRRRATCGDVPLPRILLRHPTVLCARDPTTVYSRCALDMMCRHDVSMVSRILEDFFAIRVPPECSACGQADGSWCLTTLLASSDCATALCLMCGDVVGS